QGRTADAVAALNKAWIEGRPDRAENFLNAARELDGWNLVDEARKFADEAMKRSSEDALVLHTRILMRQRQFDDVLARISRVSDGLRPQAIREMGTVVARYYSPEEKVRFAAAIERNPKRIEIATAAGFADLQAKWIYERLMASPGAENAA